MSADNRSLSLLAALAADRRLPGGAELLIWLAARVALWVHLSKSRRQLAELDPHIRNDIGLTDYDIYRETAKPFWNP